MAKKPTRPRTSIVQSLRRRLKEANDTIAAIREGHVDALVMQTPEGDQVYTLRTADQPYRLMVEQMLEGAVTLSAEGTVLYCNARFAEMVAPLPAGILGQPFAQFVAPQDRGKLEALLTSATFRDECQLLAANGTPMPTQLSGAALVIEDTRTTAVVVSDLTPERSEKALRESNRLKDEFLATLSHELRTPLNVIVGWTRMLLADQLSGSMRRRALELIEKNAQAQAQLVADLIDMSRITTGKFSLDVTSLPLMPVLQTAMDSIRPSADARGVSLRLMPPPHDATVRADPMRLQQILWNLLSNAVKFTGAGGHVCVRAACEGEHIRIDVEDSGPGIDPQFLPHVFDRFRQADSGMTRVFGGLGLGLSVVRDLVRLHHGTVEARSEGIGRGSTFIIRLPRAEPVALDPPGAASAFSNQRRLDGTSILLLEDHQDSREMTAEILQQAGVTVVQCASVAEAFAVLRREVPSAILADIGLPDEDGISFIKRLRQNSSAHIRDLPAIAVTAYASSVQQQEALTAGFHRHLAKPVDPGDLIDTLCQLLDAARSAHSGLQ